MNDSCVCHMLAMLSGEELCMVASSFSFHEQEDRGKVLGGFCCLL